MKEEHRKDIVIGAYHLYDEKYRFQDLQKFVKKNSRNIKDEWKNIILNPNWVHTDRPDWFNAHLSAGIEDTTVEDTNHYLDIHFSKRKYKHIAYLKSLSKKKRYRYLKNHGATDQVLKKDKIDEVTFHIPSNETVQKMNKTRSVYTWRSALINVLKKHEKMLRNLDCKDKFLYIYDVTPPYIFENSASVNNMTPFNPATNRQFISIFLDYPAKVIWYLKNQNILAILDPTEIKKNDLNYLEWCDLSTLRPNFAIYDSFLTYIIYNSELQRETGNYKLKGVDYLPQ